MTFDSGVSKKTANAIVFIDQASHITPSSVAQYLHCGMCVQVEGSKGRTCAEVPVDFRKGYAYYDCGIVRTRMTSAAVRRFESFIYSKCTVSFYTL